MREEFQLVGGFNKYSVRKIGDETAVNLYVVHDPSSKKGLYLTPFPGLGNPRTFPSAANGCRAALVVFDVLTGNYVVYVVVGEQIFLIDNTLVPIEITTVTITLGTTSGYCSIAAIESPGDNGHPGVIPAPHNEIMFCDGVKLLSYIPGATGAPNTTTAPMYDATTTVITGIPQYVASMDSYFIVTTQSSLRFFVSNVADGRAPFTTRFAQVDTRAMTLRGVMRLQQRLFIFGDFGIEPWLDAGSADFPFRPDNNVFIEHGLLAPGSLCLGAQRLFYLAHSPDGTPAVMMLVGNAPQKISDIELDKKIEQFNDPTDAVGFCFRISGQFFYQLNFTADNKTFLYNADSSEWTQLETGPDQVTLKYNRHFAQCHFSYYAIGSTNLDTHYIGHFNDTSFLELSEDFFTNNGEVIKKERICHVFYSPIYNNRVVSRLIIDMVQGALFANPTGTPPNTTDDDDPKVWLYVSANGGVTFILLGLMKIGKVGEYLTRTMFYQLGTYRSLTIKIVIYNTVPVYVLGGAIDYEECEE